MIRRLVRRGTTASRSTRRSATSRRSRPTGRCGFKPVGVTRRSERRPDGGWRDSLLMDLLAEELT